MWNGHATPTEAGPLDGKSGGKNGAARHAQRRRGHDPGAGRERRGRRALRAALAQAVDGLVSDRRGVLGDSHAYVIDTLHRRWPEHREMARGV